MPLARAMDNLRLAESELKNNHPDQAKAALGAATDALKNYETVTGAKDVKQLQEQINEVANNIGRYNPESFSKKVSEWWGKVVDWLDKAG
jgi:translation initiation factor 2B subunit (eIF-2B alpha/beta/delta family)